MDIIAMLTKDAGLVVGDDYTNIEKLLREGIIGTKEASIGMAALIWGAL